MRTKRNLKNMKKRSILTICILGFVTLGIYMLVWLYQTRREIVKTLNDPKAIPPFWVLFAPLLVLLVVVAAVVTSGGNTPLSNIPALLIGVVTVPAAILIPYWWIYKYSHAADRITQGTDPMLLFVLYILLYATGLGFVWMILVQNDINKYLENSGHAAPPPSAPSVPQQPYTPPQMPPPSQGQPPQAPIQNGQL
jgi:drug/metabolite transporter (DMT)-like permease